ncbi:MAG: glycoside hydrolase family 3 C-terminal domain-containing protein [Caldilineaceae bacterium]|nr:glycoside hydrolase family 3 C-terminal domain-containing protein [Caldilineaceae bacterium]
MQMPTSLTAEGVSVRDLNKNGRLDPYEDPRRPIEERVEDLLAQMTLAEKAGLMFQTFAAFVFDDGASLLEGEVGESPAGQLVTGKLMNHFNFPGILEPSNAAEWQNRMQALAEGTRLGIPITFATDPRHAFSNNPATSVRVGKFSQWPEPIGLAAIGDPAVTEEFADIARQEYLAIGIRVAIHPMADLATEPRWARINGAFGEDAALAARLTAAYIRGFQGERLGPQSVACMTKHFPGGGPQKDGEDPHFPYGKEQVYPGDNFSYHLIPFEAAFAAGTAQIMPYYGMPVGLGYEEVGFGFNKAIITELLRGKYGFDGVVCTDYGMVHDKVIRGEKVEATAWGVEHLTPSERVHKILDAGCDILGGETCPELIVELVERGVVSEARIDESARRILREKFRLGLFDNPYVDPAAAQTLVGNQQFRAAGALAQRKAIVLLKNGRADDTPVLPLRGRPKLYVEKLAAEVAGRYGEVVADIEAADWVILRLETPYQPRDGNFLERMFHAGDLDFKGEEKARILGLLQQKPTIVVIHLDRPAVIPEIAAQSVALLGEFGASDEAVLDVIFGHFAPVGNLPFELPSSMEAVRQQHPDLPYDSANPLFCFGAGLRYGET